ncbi:hypothetical protein DPMN_183716 [Dreissena polymorpha]|uniref:DUF4704 domain-containing protein n=1 Tax=Dreissena polymorpha TaxID=45954 RepID=A0A9D4DHW0_DREPO|nr:hypothetical protein DPMN_183716 [Dreissena polymorpha]
MMAYVILSSTRIVERADVINCIGGIQVWFPLLKQVNRLHLPPLPHLLTSSDGFAMSNDACYGQPVTARGDGTRVMLPSSPYADTKLEQN